MNKQNASMIPDENKIEELLAKIQPMPSDDFYQKLKQAIGQMEARQQTATKNFRSKISFAFIMLAMLTVLLITPQGRAWAQEVMQFFKKINSETIQLSDGQSKS